MLSDLQDISLGFLCVSYGYVVKFDGVVVEALTCLFIQKGQRDRFADSASARPRSSWCAGGTMAGRVSYSHRFHSTMVTNLSEL